MKVVFKNHTWEVIDHLTGKKPVGCKWVVKAQKDIKKD